jgi:hypothetical protein
MDGVKFVENQLARSRGILDFDVGAFGFIFDGSRAAIHLQIFPRSVIKLDAFCLNKYASHVTLRQLTSGGGKFTPEER